ncbi:MAG: tRNA (adenosine(37)-N6)-threonylcarbamoyltransferase complex ATPase subunit type 1 TsaE [Victivallaceae bacterium]|nr:tRNA (adenosine(37)-N6)-threonylcarbamoyltransferase complex ATPase subunit type 1 TsaE [Victivallaceae bacterium]
MSIEKTLISRSEAETEALGAEIAATLPRGSVVLLRGNLGAGKTVFARGFARGLGIDEAVSSPTYTIVQEYELDGGGRLYHLDLYRISGVAAALDFGIDEFLGEKKSVSLIEWPERIESLLPDNAVTVEIIHKGETEREIHVRR